VLAGAAVAAVAWSRRQTLFSPPRPRVWIPVAAISAVFALPIVVELVLHWPGNFGRYFSYSSSAKSAGHTTAQLAAYVLWFWWPHANAWAAPVVLAAVAVLLVWRLPSGPLRRFCGALLAVDALSTALFIGYAAAGIGALAGFHFVGYFYWSAPLLAVLVIALAATGLLPGRVAAVTAAVAAVAAAAAFAVAPPTRFDADHTDPLSPASGPVTDPALAAGTAFLAARADGRPLVFRFYNGGWVAVTGLLVQAERTGVTACVADPSWAFMVTEQFICTPAELRDGAPFFVYQPGTEPPGITVVYRLRRGIVTAGVK
jgi:hypothetical protein